MMCVNLFRSTCRLKRADHQVLWDHRLHCQRDHLSSLPKVLASAPSWDWASMAHIHSLLHHWPPLPPVTALELLDSKYVLFPTHTLLTALQLPV